MRVTNRGIMTVAIALAAGCAPADHTTDPTNSETAFESGGLAGAVSGPLGPAQTTNSSAVTLTGIVGSFTRLGLANPGDVPSTATVYFSSRGDSGAPHIWRINTSGTGLRQLTTESSGQVFPSVSHGGTRVVFRDLGLSGGLPTATDLWEWTRANGPRFLASEAGVTGIAGWVPGDTAIVYPVAAPADSGLRQRNLSGGPVTHLTDLPDRLVTSGMVDGVPTAFFTRGNSVYRIDLTTHDTSLFHRVVLPDDGIELGVFGPDLSRDGSKVLLWVEDVRGFTLFSVPTDLSDSARGLARLPGLGTLRPESRWAPGDSTFVQIETDSTGTGVNQLFLRHIFGFRMRRLTDFPAGVENGFSVGLPVPFEPRALIGDDGELGSAASGIIYGLARQGDLTTVVSFTANRQRSVSLKAETGLNTSAPVLTYTLTADRLTSLAYLADPPDGPAIGVIDSSSAVANGALISFDATTGAVALILPFATGNASQDMASVTDEAGSRLFRGRFTGVWQRGRNLAPGGASQVRLVFRNGQVDVAR